MADYPGRAQAGAPCIQRKRERHLLTSGLLQKQLRAAAAHASNAPLPDAPAPDSASDAHILSKKLTTTSNASGVLDEEASIAEAKRQEQEAERDTMPGLPATTCIGRIGRPLFRMINRPWKVR